MLRKAEPENVMGCDLLRRPGSGDGPRACTSQFRFPHVVESGLGKSAIAALGILSFGRVGRLGNGLVWQRAVPGLGLVSAYNLAMNRITIYVDWAYFLGIVGTLIGIAYYANGRITKIGTTVEWLKEILLEIKTRLEQAKVQHDLSSRVSSPHGRAKRHSRR
jgi:hypothetical protein